MDNKKLKIDVNEGLKKLPELKVSSLRLNLNGRKRKHGRNLYKKRLSQFRRTLRW